MKKVKAGAKPQTVDDYLAALPEEEARATLEKIRKTVKSAAPKATELISYLERTRKKSKGETNAIGYSN
ncbi:MAG: hypothetical protein M3410_01110 [Acidobacteriota bacterium]|nr:hypothetical protein [Acidobacteriota bacterium]